jgi:hypothetical protein
LLSGSGRDKKCARQNREGFTTQGPNLKQWGKMFFSRGKRVKRMRSGSVASLNSRKLAVLERAVSAAIEPLEKRVLLSTATFVRSDTTTQGNWGAVYGADGYSLLAGPAASLPSYAQLSASGQQSYVWGSTTDVRAPENVALQSNNSVQRTASCDYSNGAFNLNVNLIDGNTHQIAFYLLDWDSLSRAETIKAVDNSTGQVLDTRDVSNLSGGAYLVWNVTGDVSFTITRTAGPNAVVNAVFFDPAAIQPPAPAAASFVRSDVTTEGNWAGAYGTQGYSLLDQTGAVPDYANLSAAGALQYVWDSNTTDPRALQSATGTSQREATCDYSGSSFGLDLNLDLSDGATHQVALYMVDWDTTGRAQTVQVTDAFTGTVLDTESVSRGAKPLARGAARRAQQHLVRA